VSSVEEQLCIVFKNYCPVSNHPFISKVLEKVVESRLENHLASNYLHDRVQSAYCAGHSTETALLRVHHDITCALDKNLCAVLVMLDLSAAFDVIDHTILRKRLEYSFGISGWALQWLLSFIFKDHIYVMSKRNWNLDGEQKGQMLVMMTV
jgi:hypothetical protein